MVYLARLGLPTIITDPQRVHWCLIFDDSSNSPADGSSNTRPDTDQPTASEYESVCFKERLLSVRRIFFFLRFFCPPPAGAFFFAGRFFAISTIPPLGAEVFNPFGLL